MRYYINKTRSLRICYAGFSFLAIIWANDDLQMAVVTVTVADMNPAWFHDELVIGQVVADVHVGTGHESPGDADVGRLTECVLTASDTSYELVHMGLAIATGDRDGTTKVLAEGLKDILAEKP